MANWQPSVWVLVGFLALTGVPVPQTCVGADAVPAERLVFWDRDDVQDPLGKLEFHSTPLQREDRATGYPEMQFGCEEPRGDGTAWVYGWKLVNWQDRPRRTIEIIRVTTRDGKSFTDQQTVLSLLNPDWQGFVNIVHRPTDGKIFCFAWSAGELQVYSTADGTQWEQLSKKAYAGHDAMNIVWYPPTRQFLNFQNTLEKVDKRYPDNIGEYRRVISLRQSADAVQWQPVLQSDTAAELSLKPDATDPVDLEFYRAVVFPMQGRYVMLLEDYIAPPPEANSRRKTTRHGPLGEVEWATSRDGLNWRRNYRDTNAIEQVGVLAIQGPLQREGRLRFYERNGTINGLPEGRVFYLTGRGNCEFTSPQITMSPHGLTLDADVRYQPRDGQNGRAYVMAELRDAQDRPIPGYERAKCLFENCDGRALRLLWDGKSGSELKGQPIRLRIYFREARLYSIAPATE